MKAERRLEWKPIDSLTSAEKNPKRHASEDITKSMSRFGYVEPVVLDDRTGRLVAGHGRVEALRNAKQAGVAPPEGVKLDDKGGWLVPVLCGWASKDDVEAESYLIASNHLSTKGGWDTLDLADMLRGLEKVEGLDGIGFDVKDIDALLTTPTVQLGETDAFKEWEGMPEFENGDIFFRKIVVGFENQEAVDSFAKLIGQELTEKTRSIWHPYKEKRDMASLRYEEAPATTEGKSDVEAK